MNGVNIYSYKQYQTRETLNLSARADSSIYTKQGVGEQAPQFWNCTAMNLCLGHIMEEVWPDDEIRGGSIMSVMLQVNHTNRIHILHLSIHTIRVYSLQINHTIRIVQCEAIQTRITQTLTLHQTFKNTQNNPNTNTYAKTNT